MPGKPSRSRPRRRLFGGGADYVALGLIAVAAIALAALALSGVSLRSGTNPSPTSRPASTVFNLPQETPTPSPTPTPEATVSLTLLGDNSVSTDASWWAQSVTAGLVPGAVENAELAAPAAGAGLLTTEELQNRVDASTALTGFVVVQSGTGDLEAGADPVVISSRVQGLWQSVIAKGATPIVALVPPSDQYGAEVIELNGLLQTAATAAGHGILDVYSPIAAADGSYGPSFSSDGIAPNAAASQLLAQTAIAQLPQLTAAK